MMAGSQEALDRFERQTAVPMMILALAIIPLLVLPLGAGTGVSAYRHAQAYGTLHSASE
jgi:hypothetical protein